MGEAAVQILEEDNRKMENINVKLDEIQSDLQIANKVGMRRALWLLLSSLRTVF